MDRLVETVDALRELGLPCQAAVLTQAVPAFSVAEPGADWVDVLEESLLGELDAAFHQCEPSISEALEQHLARYSSEYVDKL